MNLSPIEESVNQGHASPEGMTIAYVAQYFPYLTETFVYREVAALREAGAAVITLSNRRPSPDQVSPEARHLVDETTYVFPVRWAPFLRAHWRVLRRHPARFWRTFWSVMTQPGESARNRRRTLGHFAGAVYLADRLHDQPVDHLHAHFAVNAATIAMVMAELLDLSFSFTVHNNIFTDKIVLRRKLEKARFIVSISAYSRDYLLRWAPDIDGLAEKMHVVHCGIAPDAFASTGEDGLGAGRALDRGKARFFSLARFDEKKGLPDLVEACRILRDDGRAFCCLIGGDGPQFALVQQLVRAYGLEGDVRLLGRLFHDDVERYYREADLFVLPCVTAADGDVDGIPVVLMEAMALGRPVVSTRVSGIPELIEDGVSGLLVEEKSPRQLAAAIARLLDAPEEARRLGANGRTKVAADFNLERSAAELAALFRGYVPGPAERARNAVVVRG